ncbi:DUF3987 domain-containing protein [Mariniflexile sp. AS56]|uniref:DUF3987 domain-containing protein n=1 Tax=Mariniflexile sp. AS56 TaxID=3063957 RepID=UPI0026F36FED|nr:DUF3987 domain-containing protein [Mariniflexile sp. AS56]MDO7173454.1 DUF3987 domain-containing protein [Mariniflexile sp. AS56]
MQDKNLILDSIDSIENKIDKYVLSNKEIAINELNKVISLLPIEIRDFIEGAFKYKRIPKEYLLSSILFAFSNAAGLAFKIDCMNHTNYPNLYFAIVGSRGDTKSSAMDLATAPLNEVDNKEYKEFKQKEKEMKELPSEDMEELKRTQLFVQNATIEATMYVHYKNPYSVGVFVDELTFLIEKMANNNSSEGAGWRTFLLQGYTNQHIDISRKTTDSYRINTSCPSLLGSIQHQFIPKMLANGNLESGLIDRWLFANKLTGNTEFSKEIMPSSMAANYNYLLLNLYKYRKSVEENKHEYNIPLSAESINRIGSYSQNLLNKQEGLGEYNKEYISKMLISIHKLVLLVHLIKNAAKSTFKNTITIDTVELAILLNEFYFTNFKIVIDSKEKSFDEKSLVKEIFIKAIKNGANQTDVIKITGLSKGYVSKKWNHYLKEGNRKQETTPLNS